MSMQRRNFLKGLGLISAGTLPALPALSNGFRLDRMLKGKVHSKGKGLANVGVSDGFQIVSTAKDGSYQLQAHPNASHVFVILPAGYHIPNDKGIARFYAPINNTGTQTADFALEPIAGGDDEHAFIVWGDTQIWDKEDAQQLVQVSATDTKAAVAALGGLPTFGIGCGDLVFDKFELFEDYKKAVEVTGIPFFQVIGNHDMDLTARTDDQSQQTFKQQFGPTYYSFNRGAIHYVVLDDVFYLGMAKKYVGYISEAQLAWLEEDLKRVPAGSTVVVSLHIPTDTGMAERQKKKEEELGGIVTNRAALYAMLKPYKAHIMSGHTHFNENWEKDNIMEHNHGTVCGAWWTGPVCGDGCPPGYGVYKVKGNDISWHYQSVGKAANHQVRLYKAGSVSEQANAVVANVWNYDPAWKVEWWLDGKSMGAMQPFVGLDPLAKELYLGNKLPAKHKWVEPVLTNHLFATAAVQAGQTIVVKATDRFGQVFEESITA